MVPTDWAVKVSAITERLTDAAVPLPARLIDCAVPFTPLLLSVIVIAPDLAPTAVGLNVIKMLQLDCAPTLEPQLLVWVKSPLAMIFVINRGPVPAVLSTFTV